MIDEADIAVGRLRQFAAGLGMDETTLRLIVLTVWTDSVERTAEEKVAEVRRRLMRAAGPQNAALGIPLPQSQFATNEIAI